MLIFQRCTLFDWDGWHRSTPRAWSIVGLSLDNECWGSIVTGPKTWQATRHNALNRLFAANTSASHSYYTLLSGLVVAATRSDREKKRVCDGSLLVGITTRAMQHLLDGRHGVGGAESDTEALISAAGDADFEHVDVDTVETTSTPPPLMEHNICDELLTPELAAQQDLVSLPDTQEALTSDDSPVAELALPRKHHMQLLVVG